MINLGFSSKRKPSKFELIRTVEASKKRKRNTRMRIQKASRKANR
jgi:hypothetical protein